MRRRPYSRGLRQFLHWIVVADTGYPMKQLPQRRLVVGCLAVPLPGDGRALQQHSG